MLSLLNINRTRLVHFLPRFSTTQHSFVRPISRSSLLISPQASPTLHKNFAQIPSNQIFDSVQKRRLHSGDEWRKKWGKQWGKEWERDWAKRWGKETAWETKWYREPLKRRRSILKGRSFFKTLIYLSGCVLIIYLGWQLIKVTFKLVFFGVGAALVGFGGYYLYRLANGTHQSLNNAGRFLHQNRSTLLSRSKGVMALIGAGVGAGLSRMNHMFAQKLDYPLNISKEERLSREVQENSMRVLENNEDVIKVLGRSPAKGRVLRERILVEDTRAQVWVKFEVYHPPLTQCSVVKVEAKVYNDEILYEHFELRQPNGHVLVIGDNA
eukprot:TRINITY_DN2792_c0_g2_i1.p1 TRINITY_DN2792_c0_g2~~TRINITY_DN2792_c0_g2_i1.p1  ORF type:complete len:325 (-),score=37.14 TRINITY_DN2792_c0_g2_i1:57-1031(-)